MRSLLKRRGREKKIYLFNNNDGIFKTKILNTIFFVFLTLTFFNRIFIVF